jgi:hypothetical protein
MRLSANIAAFGKDISDALQKTTLYIPQNIDQLTNDWLLLYAIGLGVGTIHAKSPESYLAPFVDTNAVYTEYIFNTRDLEIETNSHSASKFVFKEHLDCGHAGINAAGYAQRLLDFVTFHTKKAEEKKSVHPNELIVNQTPNVQEISAITQNQFCLPKQLQTYAKKTHAIKRAAIIGVGGIGTYVALDIAPELEELVLIDGDRVETKNLNRQICYGKHVGSYKVRAMAEELSKISQAKIHMYGDYVTQENISLYLDKHNLDAVFICTDTKKSRYDVSTYTADKMRTLEAGCNTTSCVALQHLPTQNQPIHILRGFTPPFFEVKRSCGDEINPSVVIPNAMAGHLLHILGYVPQFLDKVEYVPVGTHTISQNKC